LVVNTIAFAGMGQANFKSIRSSTDSLLPNYKVWQRYLSVAAQPASRYLSLLSYQFNFPYQVNIMSLFICMWVVDGYSAPEMFLGGMAGRLCLFYLILLIYFQTLMRFLFFISNLKEIAQPGRTGNLYQ